VQFRKPEWLDTAVGITGLVLALFALLIGAKLSSTISAYAAAGLCIFIILVAVFFRPRHSLRTLALSERTAFLVKASANAEEIIVVNPSPERFDFTPHLDRALESNVHLSVIGSAPLLQEVLRPLRAPLQDRFLKTARLSDSLSDEPLICIASRGLRRLTILFLADRETVVLRISDPPIVRAILGIIGNSDGPSRSYARLDHASEMRALLEAFTVEQKRYLENFGSLRQGHLSFHGSEVQQLQSTLVESGRFKQIDTLDVTSAPDLLLLRRRYIDANTAFIQGGGTIRRVYMIEAKKQHDHAFMRDLKELVALQRSIGVTLGLVIIDDLEPALRKDFILFDDAIVLVEERQANLDYSLGRSTAYFSRTDVAQYRSQFDRVWTVPIGGCTPPQRLEKIIPG
jgi:hypothetical protein